MCHSPRCHESDLLLTSWRPDDQEGIPFLPQPLRNAIDKFGAMHMVRYVRIKQVDELLHGKEQVVHAGYRKTIPRATLQCEHSRRAPWPP